MVIGGAVTLGVLNACGSDSSNSVTTPVPDPTPTPTPTPTETPATPTGPLATEFPYQQHLEAGYRLDVAAVKEAAYHGYYAGGCCHGAYNGLMKHLADTAGAPFNLLPLEFGGFGGGGIAGYGSICGAVLGGVLVINSVVPNTAPAGEAASKINVRNRMMVELIRWYESFAFPTYVPAAVDAKETGLTLDFGSANLVTLQTVAGSHLCHASVTKWCEANGNANPNGGDKKARCARLTADVAAKVAEMLNGYLATGEFVAAAVNGTGGCVNCHGAVANAPAAPTAAGMDCVSCHPVAGHALPTSHPSVQTANCKTCHPG
jgi:hypothetical protein